MITLSNINEFTNQQIFEQCAKHLINQGKQSKGKVAVSCKYREGNLKCAVGCFISDDEYSADMEGWEVWELITDFYPDVDSSKTTLLRELQVIHDTHIPAEWKELLLHLAGDYKLDTTFFDDLPPKKVIPCTSKK